MLASMRSHTHLYLLILYTRDPAACTRSRLFSSSTKFFPNWNKSNHNLCDKKYTYTHTFVIWSEYSVKSWKLPRSYFYMYAFYLSLSRLDALLCVVFIIVGFCVLWYGNGFAHHQMAGIFIIINTIRQNWNLLPTKSQTGIRTVGKPTH